MAEVTPTLETKISEQVYRFCQQGYQLYDQGNFKAAIRQFYCAWTSLPKSQSQWREAGWVLTALGDAYFSKENFNSGIEALRSALHCPEAASNPFIHLRLGQCLYELDQTNTARQHFQLTIEHDGEKLFDKETAKYHHCVKGCTV